jgi:hypothetical protein
MFVKPADQVNDNDRATDCTRMGHRRPLGFEGQTAVVLRLIMQTAIARRPMLASAYNSFPDDRQGGGRY